MFHVPKSAGGHPRLTMAILAGFAVAIVALSLAVGLLPALRAKRLKIVDALAGR